MSEEKKLTQDVTSDKNHWPTWLLGFFLPVVGYILYLVWKEEKPRYSNSTGWGSLLGCFFYIVVAIVLILVL